MVEWTDPQVWILTGIVLIVAIFLIIYFKLLFERRL